MTQVTVGGNILVDRTITIPRQRTCIHYVSYTPGRNVLNTSWCSALMRCIGPASLRTREHRTLGGALARTRAQGIKTSHHTVSPTAGNFEVVSNPYRATTDDTMGWTRTKRDTMGRMIEVNSFLGSALPSPWGRTGQARAPLPRRTPPQSQQLPSKLDHAAERNGSSRTA